MRTRLKTLTCRKFDCENCAAAERGRNKNLTAMQSRQMLNDRQTETGAADFSGSTAVDPVETLEYTLKIFRHDSFAGIRHRYQALSVRF